MKKRDQEQIEDKIWQWLLCAPTALQEEIQRLQKSDPFSLYERFCVDLSFGTSGLRAPLGAGTAYINTLTVTRAAAALALFLSSKIHGIPRCVICYDNRKDSKLLASDAARALSSRSIDVILCEEMRPVPFLSFCVRSHRAHAGVMITASHNPPQYNGFKVYNEHGAEIGPADETEIQKIMLGLDECSLWQKRQEVCPSVTVLSTVESDAAYIKEIVSLMLYPEYNKQHVRDLHIVYSALYGTGSTLASKALASCGFSHLTLVDGQCTPSEVFEDIPCPNPEERVVYDKGLKVLLHHGADMLAVNDADADRIGVAISHRGSPYIFSGNEIAAMLFYHRCCVKKERGDLSDDSFVIYSFVTTPLLGVIASHFGLKHYVVPTGFKYIGLALADLQEKDLVMAAEESYGCLLGSYTRDKDGIAALCAMAELALHLKSEGKNLKDFLDDIYKIFGVFREKQASILFSEESQGRQALCQVMGRLRESLWRDVCGKKVLHITDHLARKSDMACDAIEFALEDGSKLLIRPSGTEPKLRIHISMVEKTEDVDEAAISLDKKIEDMIDKVKKRLL